jgi:hypothetical protein
MTADVVRKLIDAFKLDVNVEEACLYADISKDAYYRKLKEDEGFSDEIDSARMYATMTARLSIIKALPSDPHLALKYLERKRREEFSLQHRAPQNGQESQIDLGAEAKARLEPETLRLVAKYLVPPEGVFN